MKFKKVFCGAFSILVPIIPIATTVSYSSGNVAAKNNEVTILKDEFNNIDSLKNSIAPYYEDLSAQAESSVEYTKFVNWARTTDENTVGNPDLTCQKIAQTSMSNGLKNFALLNYWEKYTTYESERTYESNLIEKSKKVMDAYIQDDDNHPLHIIVDPIVKMELVPRHIGYRANSNKFLEYKGDDDRAILQSGEDKFITDYHPFADDYTHIEWSNETILNQAMSQALNELSSHLHEKNEVLTYLKGIAEVYGGTIGHVIEEALKDCAKVFRISSSFIIGEVMPTLLTAGSQDWNYPSSALLNTVIQAGPVLVASAINPIIGLAAAAAELMLDLIPSGNGHSLLSNLDDHGLNDWDFQIKNNFDTILRIAVEWSENYHNGVDWEIRDSWLSTPTLRIKTQNMDESYRSISQGGTIFSNSFNWGNKVEFVSKH